MRTEVGKSLKEVLDKKRRESMGERFKDRRDRLDIIAAILSAARGEGQKKTAIAYKANLNFNRAEKYLKYLEEKGLIENINGEYWTTEKGEEFLRDYQKIMELLSE